MISLENLKKYKTFIFIAADILLIILSVYLAFFLRFEGVIPLPYFVIIARLAIINLLFCIPAFFFYKLYSFSWSYISLQDLVALFKSVFLSLLLTIVVLFFFRASDFFSGFPRSIIFISYFFIFLFCGGIRFAKRLYNQLFPSVAADAEKKDTLIVGAGDAGEQIVRSILNSKIGNYIPIGFVDDDKTKWGNLIHGVRILGNIEMIPKIITQYPVQEMIIALPSAGSQAIKRAVELGRQAGLKKIKVVPSIFEVINSNVSISQVREVDVEDLLERDPFKLDTKAIAQFINGKIVLITGGAGSIGSELCRQVAKFNPRKLLLLDQDETGVFMVNKELNSHFPDLSVESFVADIRDRSQVSQIFEKYKPSIIFHAAAYKHVPVMERQPDEAVKNNIFGTKIIAQAAIAHHAEKFIFISTDKAVNPTSVMGATKRICEMVCQELNQKNITKFISVRFGNVLNSRGSVIPIFRDQIKRGGPVEVTDPRMNRFFMLTSEACLLVMQAGTMGQGGEVFVLDMGKPINISGLAQEMIRLSGFQPDKDIPIVYIGARPGEKLSEEILTAEEGTIATQNKKIFIAKLSKIDGNKLDANLKKLKLCLDSGNYNKIKSVLKDFIPSYAPSDHIN